MKILDIGCGTSGILPFLHSHEVQYFGYDFNKNYIENSKKRWSSLGEYRFFHQSVDEVDCSENNTFDIVILLNLFHHLTDNETKEIINKCGTLLKQGGSLISCDPCRFEKMSWFEKFMVKYDRGKNIKSKEEYKHLFNDKFKLKEEVVTYLANIPQRGVLFHYEKIA